MVDGRVGVEEEEVGAAPVALAVRKEEAEAEVQKGAKVKQNDRGEETAENDQDKNPVKCVLFNKFDILH